MAYSADKKPGELTALTSLATDDVFVVGDTSDASEVAKGITKANLITDLNASLTPALAATVTTNANLTGHVTSVGNAAVLGSFTVAQLSTALSDADISGTNTGDQTSIVGITGTKAQFDTAVTDGNFMYVGDAPTSHTHLLSEITDSTTEALGVGSLEVGHASDTTISRVSAGKIAVEGVNVVTTSSTDTLTNKTLTAPTLTGTTTADRFDYDRAIGLVNAIGNLGATETIDWSTHTHYTGTLDSNITFTYSNQVSGQTVTLYLSYDGSAQRTITWPTTTWMDNATGAAPATPAASGKVLVVTLVYIGTTTYGSATGNYAVYA